MPVSMAARSLLFKEVLSSPFGVNALLKQFSVYKPESVKKFEEIPRPRTVPHVGKMWNCYLGKYPLANLPQVYDEYYFKYGPLVKEEVFPGRTLVHVFTPLDMQKIYSLDKTNHPCRVSHTALEEYRMHENFKNPGLPCSNGETWAELREILGEDLFKNHHRVALKAVAEDFVLKIHKLISYKAKKEVDMLPWLYYWALECTAAVVLGESFWVFRDQMILKPVSEFIEFIRKSREMIFYTDSLPRMITGDCRKELAELQYAIALFLYRPMSYTLWGLYEFGLPSSLTFEGAPICLKNSISFDLVERDVDIADISTFILDFFQGGIHSPAHILGFALYYLATNPEEQEKVRKVLKDKNGVLDDKFKGGPVPVFKVITNVILETMRLNPPTTGTSRVLPEPLILSGYNVPKGTTCILHHQLASLRFEHFQNAYKFIPDRFNSPLSKEAMIANSPFGMGKRECPMKEMAMTELCYTLTMILSDFKVSYNYAKIGTKCGFVNEPDRDIILHFTPSRVYGKGAKV